MKDLLKRIVQALVDHPEQVEISEVKGQHVSILELKVAKEDIGKVIGKKGRNV
ncbi:MAG: KH domain-containing protein, partial [Desulfobacterales bacterium]|nr:KH domain-containing protein [Desulfobacterales bacterium]